jgi:transposase-like protein
MHVMPKKIDPAVKERCVRLALEQLPQFPSLTAVAESVARREGLGKETVRRWVVQAQIDGGQRQGATSEELAQIRELKARVRRLEEDNEVLRRAAVFFAGELDPRNR